MTMSAGAYSSASKASCKLQTFQPELRVVSVVNLTNEKLHTYLQFPNEPFTYDDVGRRLFFGVKGKL